MKRQTAKNTGALPPELEREASRFFGRHVTPEKALVTLVFCLLTCAAPMLLGLRLWDRIPKVVETGLIGPGGTDDSLPRAVLVFGIPGLVCVLALICHAQLWFHQLAGKIPPTPVRIFGRWGIPVIFVPLCAFWIGRSGNIETGSRFFIPCMLALLLLLLGSHFFDCKTESGLAFHFKSIEHWENPWRKTHRLAGICWMLAGLLLLVFRFVMDPLPWYSFALLILLLLSEFPAARVFSR